MSRPNFEFPAIMVLQRTDGGVPEVIPFGGVQVYAVNGATLTDLDWSFDPFRRHLVMANKAAFEASTDGLPSEGLELLEQHIDSVISYSRRRWALRVVEQAKSQSLPSRQPVVIDLDIGNLYWPNQHEILTFPNVPVVEIPPKVFDSMQDLNHLLSQLPFSAQQRAIAAVDAPTRTTTELDF